MNLYPYHSSVVAWTVLEEKTKNKPIRTETDVLPSKVKKTLLISHLFQIKDELFTLIKKTQNKWYERKLPFNNIFINKELIYQQIKVNGFILTKIFCEEHKREEILCYAIMSTDNYSFEPLMFILLENEKDYLNQYQKWKDNKQIVSLIVYMKNFIIPNFLDFLNNPEVELITVERTKEQNEKRIKRGKQPIPTIHNIRVSGKLKIYLDHINSNPNLKYSHRFDVRGHWRMLRSDRWGKHKGTKIWIPPYIKGDGLYVKKNYEVTNDKN